jgi:ribose 5-phosphate isomerase B
MIFLASDHAGFELKQKLASWLKKENIDFFDCGASEFDALDSYVLHAKNAIEKFNETTDSKLILICGSGVGMSIVANRNSKIRAVLCLSPKQAVQARKHNNANCLCLGARNTSFFTSKRIIKKFLSTDFLGGKYQDRLNDI